jgi:hypothetical protein
VASTLALLAGCGGSDVGPAPSSSPAASEEPDLRTVVEQRQDGTTEIIPLSVEIEGPVEYEPVVEAPLVTAFPEGGAAPRPSIELPPDDPVLGQPLVINGKVVPAAEVMKHVCLGSIGMSEIESRKALLFMEEEIQRRLQAGAARADFEVGDEELAQFMQTVEEELKAEYPEGDVGLEEMLGGVSPEETRALLRVQRQFQKLFLPENPEDFPPITVEAILKYPGGDTVLENYRTEYLARAEARKQAPPGAKEPRRDRSFEDALLQQVNEHMQTVARIEREPAPGVLLRVNGKDITVEAVWKAIQGYVSAMDILAAKQWIVNSTLLQEAFVAAGVWLTPEEAEAAYEAHSAPYRESIFSQEGVALSVKGFPSIDRYKEYRRLYESMHRLRRPQMTPEELDRHTQTRLNKIVGQVSADVDVILCSAFDFKAQRWKRDGWIDAAQRMREVIRLLVEEQRPWEELLQQRSDFTARPVPAGEDELAGRGLFRNFQRNNLLRELGESEYFSFLNGGTLTDFIFFDQAVGTLGQPVRGPYGWYLPRLLRRSVPPPRLPIKEETLKTMVTDDYVGTSLREFARELVSKNEVYGLEIPGQAPAMPK